MTSRPRREALFSIRPPSSECLVEPPVFDAAWSLFLYRADKPWSFTDCTSFVLMDNLGIRQAVAFDANFRQAGFATFPLTRSWRLGRRPLRSPPRSAGRLAIAYRRGASGSRRVRIGRGGRDRRDLVTSTSGYGILWKPSVSRSRSKENT